MKSVLGVHLGLIRDTMSYMREARRVGMYVNTVVKNFNRSNQ